ncbi:nucleolar ATPase Kre33 [Pyrenophora seminiperda CCB06]|uniref:RNA cytidine acetyltransferase n=1 Tax=Pyrenophora seminiperda CCB06 TaxID=1302712 RepID=A0A3M7LX81_9PLEO|nr:nucleolar ATPase Kre33 [Pyrenophora seminiperda CCB06]
MTIRAAKFTPEVLLSAPRRSAGVPNSDASKILYELSTYSFSEHVTKKEIRVLDVASQQSGLVTDDKSYSEPTWLDDETVLLLKSNDDGTTDIVAGLPKKFEQSKHAAGTIQGPVSDIKIHDLGGGEFALAVVGKAKPDGTLLNPEKVEKLHTSGKLYKSGFVRHWDHYVTENRNAIWLGKLRLKKTSGCDVFVMQHPLTNALKETPLESPIEPFGGKDHFDISKHGLVFTSKDPDINPATHTKTNIYVSASESFWDDLHSKDIPEIQKVSIEGFEGASTSPVWSNSGSMVAFLSMKTNGYESDKNQAFIMHDFKKPSQLTPLYASEDGKGRWDRSPQSISWSHDDWQLYFTAEEHGRGNLYSAGPPKPGTEKQPLPSLLVKGGTIGSVQALKNGDIFITSTSLTENSLYSLVPLSTHPGGEVSYTLPLDDRPYDSHAKDMTTKYISSNTRSGSTFGLSRNQIDEIHWDGAAPDTKVHAWVVKPSDFSEEKTYPLAYLVHGGPQGAWTDGWSTRWNPAVFAEQGYVVICPNPTGSTSYGQAFTDAIQHQWGGLPYEDLVLGFNYIKSHVDYVDTTRAVALGASYGGYMMNWIQGHPLGREFKALVTHDGVFSMTGQMASEELYFPFHDIGGTLWKNPENWAKWDPSKFTQNWATPHLIIHSELDYRLTISEGLAAFNVLQCKGVESQFLTFPDENHWVLKPENGLMWHQVVLDWINEHVGLEKRGGDACGALKMPKKAIDSRIPALIRNGAQEKKRSFFVVVGDRQKDVIVNLYHILLSVDVKLNKSVLWAYKNKLLGFSSHRKKREKKIKNEIKRGIRDVDTDDPFELFVSTQNIRYVYYKETDKILGNTYGMCILQDFEALTPNLLARTIETVEGGGLVILLLKGMSSLKQLYTLSMDIHSRYRTEAHSDVVARFNERFILSLGKCDSCLVVDDELNVLPISGGKHVKQLPPPDTELEGKTPKAKELAEIKESLADSPPTGDLVKLAKTVDQAKALLTFVEAIVEKTLRSTVTLTAARGRGKSAALGVAVAAAVAHGYSNIYITSPSPENLKTLFEFILKGFDSLNYVDHQDYTIMQSTQPDQNKAIVRIELHRQHRQVIQYIKPEDSHVLGQAELLVIDEAAAIPLPLVRKLMGPYLVFMASTINGYEGTGRSLSLKLIQQLREQSRGKGLNGSTSVVDRSTGKETKDGTDTSMTGRSLREITLSEPIRYAQGDSVERWMNDLLCLDATLPRRSTTQGCPHPDKCQLLHVNRDTLFSYNPAAEKFLQKMMALYVASHYKNTPNDLQLMSDAPAHQLFVLTGPTEENKLPEPLCVIQVALEGQISKESVLNSLSRGQRAGGDLIPWIVSQQFQDENFASLSGARVVRIATNPEYVNMGYGSKALQLLVDFYDGKLASLSENEPQEVEQMRRVTEEDLEDASLLKDNVKIREASEMPPLFARLQELKAPKLDYVGVSYGLTSQLHKFWKRASFVPVYLRQTPNDLTGEHTCIMLRSLETTSSDGSWVAAFAKDFQKRFLSLLSYQFRTFPSITSLTIEESASAGSKLDADLTAKPISKAELDALFTPFDLKRLDSYANNMLDYHVILDMLPPIASLYFTGRLKGRVKLTGIQAALLLAIGLQRKEFSDVEKELADVNSSQLMAMFVKVMRKVATAFRSIVEGAVEETMPEAMDVVEKTGAQDDGLTGRFQPLEKDLQEELREGGDEFLEEERERQRSMIDALPLHKYEIGAGPTDWEDAERAVSKAASKGGNAASMTVAVKTGEKKRKVGEAVEEAYKEAEKFKEKKSKKHKSGKKA